MLGTSSAHLTTLFDDSSPLLDDMRCFTDCREVLFFDLVINTLDHVGFSLLTHQSGNQFTPSDLNG